MEIRKFEFNMFPVNCYILWDDTCEAVIIDPGCFYEDEKEELKTFIHSNHLKVRHILNTHLHLDHIFGNAFALQTFGVAPKANQADEFLIEEAPNQSRMFGFELPEPMIGLGGYIYDGDTICFGHTELTAMLVPGHSPGSLLYYCKEASCIFSGDVIFKGSIGRADLKGGNYDQLITSINQRIFSLPSETIIYPGHGPSTTVGTEKQSNPFFH